MSKTRQLKIELPLRLERHAISMPKKIILSGRGSRGRAFVKRLLTECLREQGEKADVVGLPPPGR